MPTKIERHVLLNQEKVSAWRPDGPTGGKCLWEMHGVWAYDEKFKTAIVLREHYFNNNPQTGGKVSIEFDCCICDINVESYRLTGIPTSTTLSYRNGRKLCARPAYHRS